MLSIEWVECFTRGSRVSSNENKHKEGANGSGHLGGEGVRKRKTNNAAAVSAMKKRRDNYAKTQRLMLVVLVVLAVFVAAIFAWTTFKPNDHMVPDGQKVNVSFPNGFLSSEYAEVLYDDGVIDNKDSFNREVNDRDLATSLKPGVYCLTGGMSVSEIVDQIVEGPNATFTIKKGDSLETIAATIAETYDNTVQADELMAKFTHLGEYLSDYPFLEGHDTMDGFLQPGTYDTQVFGTMEFASARANLVTRQLLDSYVEAHGGSTGSSSADSSQ